MSQQTLFVLVKVGFFMNLKVVQIHVLELVFLK